MGGLSGVTDTENTALFLLCRKYRSDISGITRKSTTKNLIGEADFFNKEFISLMLNYDITKHR